MNIHEYQAKEILRSYGLKIPDFAVISNLDEVEFALSTLQTEQAVVKIQVHAGGRGKAGGVKLCKNKQEVLDAVKALLNMKVVNAQTGPEGMVAHRLLITKPVDIKKEYYLGAIIDRESASALLVASPSGGMDIEEVAAKTPEKILTLPITNQGKLRSYHLVELVKFMGWQGSLAKEGMEMAKTLARIFIEKDASLLEINPLVETQSGELLLLDAKLTIDENALFRHPELKKMYDPTQLPKNEAAANQFDLAYVSLDGNVGCMVNGAGLAMATMDIIKHFGGKPANFLDVGGGASEEKVAEGFKLILGDPNVKGVLVNIFGGIMSCETLANGIIAAAQKLKINVPLVVRMEGTHVEEGRKKLEESGLPIITAKDLTEAAHKIMNALS